jgi:hypothetical protein
MQQLGFRMGGRPGGVGCVLLAIPFLALLGAALVVSWVVGLLADLLLPSGASPLLRFIVGVAALWILLRLWRIWRSRRRPPRGGGGLVIDI